MMIGRNDLSCIKRERTSRARVSLIGETITQKGQEELGGRFKYFYLHGSKERMSLIRIKNFFPFRPEKM